MAQIWRELVPHYFLKDCFGGSSELAGTGSTLFSGGLFSRQLRQASGNYGAQGAKWQRITKLEYESFMYLPP